MLEEVNFLNLILGMKKIKSLVNFFIKGIVFNIFMGGLWIRER